MEIKILCYRTPVCYSVWRVVQQAINQLSPQFPDADITINMIKDSTEIAKYTHNLLLPSLVINEKLICSGHIPSNEEVVAWLQVALATSGYQPVAMNG
ncbi:MAG: hypothetical protein A2X25_00465 [Chloroflexi bacterium GWB2_49_20]|nr:MAG: hypothetical protein A2X25_00465 [Chloroflexi bacterium GWB2_49_20]OGN80153.1 MAG: hypothetical protein A2X26_09320 [Chloroflexi bacterium GWC2_49_37]OGN83126.1 MAG: hypothetical protein A2X27_13080 [Chloroflexi bacterium GWD2_49_16]